MKNKQLKRLGKILFSLTLIFSSIGISNIHIVEAKKISTPRPATKPSSKPTSCKPNAKPSSQTSNSKPTSNSSSKNQLLVLKELTTKAIIVIIIKVTKNNIQTI